MQPPPGWWSWSVGRWHFLWTLVNTQPAAGESWMYKLYVKPVAFLALLWFSVVLGASKIGSLLHIVLVSCQFLSIFANLFMHNKKCHPLLSQFCFLFSGSIFCANVLQQSRQWSAALCPGLHTAECTGGGEIVNIAPLLSQPLSILSLLSPQLQFGQLSVLCAAAVVML